MPHSELHAAGEESRQSLLNFLRDMDEHISAIQAAGHERLAGGDASPGAAPVAVEIMIRIGPEQNPNVAFAEGLGEPQCVTTRVPCGKGKSGYIYCEVSYCETTGPITVTAE